MKPSLCNFVAELCDTILVESEEIMHKVECVNSICVLHIFHLVHSVLDVAQSELAFPEGLGTTVCAGEWATSADINRHAVAIEELILRDQVIVIEVAGIVIFQKVWHGVLKHISRIVSIYKAWNLNIRLIVNEVSQKRNNAILTLAATDIVDMTKSAYGLLCNKLSLWSTKAYYHIWNTLLNPS